MAFDRTACIWGAACSRKACSKESFSRVIWFLDPLGRPSGFPDCPGFHRCGGRDEGTSGDGDGLTGAMVESPLSDTLLDDGSLVSVELSRVVSIGIGKFTDNLD